MFDIQFLEVLVELHFLNTAQIHEKLKKSLEKRTKTKTKQNI